MLENKTEGPAMEKQKNLNDAENGTALTSNERRTAETGGLKWKMATGLLLLIALVVVLVVAPIVISQRSEDDLSTSSPRSTDAANQQRLSPSADAAESHSMTTDGPFNTTIELLSKDVPKGYKSTEELENGIENAAKFLVKIVHDRNIKNKTKTGETKSVNKPILARQGGPVTSNDQTMKQIDSFTGYGTNNQEKAIEESDMVVSDGNYVYAAYGKYFVILNVESGAIIKEVEMPAINTTHLGSECYYGEPEPVIRSLLLHEGRLLVVVEGYGQELQHQSDNGEGHVLFDYLATHLRLYDTQSLFVQNSNSDGLLGTTNINGRFSAARAIGPNLHIVTTSEVDTTKDLEEPFERTRLGSMLANSAYSRLVERLFQAKVSSFKDKLINDLKAGMPDGMLPFLARINLWQQSASKSSLEEDLYDRGLLNSLIMVSSLDLSQTPVSNGLQIDSSSGAFAPSTWAEVYANKNHVVVACEVWEYDEETYTSTESTALLAFKLDGSSSKPLSVGKVPGVILNAHSIDVVDDTLRVAVSIQDAWTKEGEDWAMEHNSASVNYIIILAITKPDTSRSTFLKILRNEDIDDDGTGEMTELGRLRLGKPNELFTAVRFFNTKAIASTFEFVDPFYVLDLSESSNPKIVGELTLEGYPDYFHSINDEDSLILAIGHEADSTGVQLSLFDIRVPDEPKVLHTHNFTSNDNDWIGTWSDSTWDFKAIRFLQGRLIIPMQIDETNYESNGTKYSHFSGFLVFDVDESRIDEHDCRIVNEEYSEYYDDHYHYYDDYDWDAYYDDYDDYDSNGHFAVTVLEDDDNSGNRKLSCPYYGGWLPMRSMLFDGNLMTMGHSNVALTDLDTCTTSWNRTIEIYSDGDCN